MMPTVALINRSSVVTDHESALMAIALQTQVSRDFAPIWGMGATVDFVPGATIPPPGCWWLTILDDADQAMALGYHELTDEGLPIGKVFARTSMKAGDEVSVVASHELLESLSDPNVNLMCQVYPARGAPEIFAYENCDACESDEFGYEIGGILVSDFVTPSWFNSAAPSDSMLDFKGYIAEPLQLLKGGYIGVRTLMGWTQITADRGDHKSTSNEYVGNRWHRRNTPDHARRLSSAYRPA